MVVNVERVIDVANSPKVDPHFDRAGSRWIFVDLEAEPEKLGEGIVPSESGAIGVIYAILVSALVYRTLSFEGFRTAVRRAVRTTGMVMILVACARAFAHMLALYQVPELLTELIFLVSENPIIVLLFSL